MADQPFRLDPPASFDAEITRMSDDLKRRRRFPPSAVTTNVHRVRRL
jgi:hypothetical protein